MGIKQKKLLTYLIILVEIDAYMGRKFKGVVSEIANSASIEGASTDQVTSFEVRIHLLKESYRDLITENNPYPFRPGLSATVDIMPNTRDNVLSVPIQAVTTRTDTSDNNILNEVVFIVRSDSVLLTPVETGIQDNEYIEIVDGLEESDKVVTAPYSAISRRLNDGDNVNVVKKQELYNEEYGTLWH